VADDAAERRFYRRSSHPIRRFPMKKHALALAMVMLVVPAVASASTTILRLTEKQTFQHYTDKGSTGESAGDIRTFGGIVFKNGIKVGHDQIRCVVAATCDAQVWIQGGSLISKGFVAKGPSFTARITGGTGRYTRAHGTVTVVGGPITHYVVKLVN
jgi:hypothetical protein